MVTAGFRHLITVPCERTERLSIVTTALTNGRDAENGVGRFRGVWTCWLSAEDVEADGTLTSLQVAVGEENVGEGDVVEGADVDSVASAESDNESDSDSGLPSALYLVLFTDKQGTYMATEDRASYFTRYVPLSGLDGMDQVPDSLDMDEGRGRVVLMVSDRIVVLDFAEGGGNL